MAKTQHAVVLHAFSLDGDYASIALRYLQTSKHQHWWYADSTGYLVSTFAEHKWSSELFHNSHKVYYHECSGGRNAGV